MYLTRRRRRPRTRGASSIAHGRCCCSRQSSRRCGCFVSSVELKLDRCSRRLHRWLESGEGLRAVARAFGDVTSSEKPRSETDTSQLGDQIGVTTDNVDAMTLARARLRLPV
jgi:hypothetical protein